MGVGGLACLGDDPYGVLAVILVGGFGTGRCAVGCGRGVNAARVAFVVGRGAACLRGGFWAWVVWPAWATTPTVSWR